MIKRRIFMTDFIKITDAIPFEKKTENIEPD